MRWSSMLLTHLAFEWEAAAAVVAVGAAVIAIRMRHCQALCRGVACDIKLP